MASFGRLQIHVFTSRANLPLENAAVIVTQTAGNGKPVLLRFLLTDPDGNTDSVTIESPDEEASQSTGGALPYSLVDILVDQPDYNRMAVKNIQIFPGIVSIQDVQLTPSSLGQPSGRETIVIQAQDL